MLKITLFACLSVVNLASSRTINPSFDPKSNVDGHLNDLFNELGNGTEQTANLLEFEGKGSFVNNKRKHEEELYAMLAYKFETRTLRLNFAINRPEEEHTVHFDFNFNVDHKTIAGGFLNGKNQLNQKQMFDLSTGQIFFKDQKALVTIFGNEYKNLLTDKCLFDLSMINANEDEVLLLVNARDARQKGNSCFGMDRFHVVLNFIEPQNSDEYVKTMELYMENLEKIEQIIPEQYLSQNQIGTWKTDQQNLKVTNTKLGGFFSEENTEENPQSILNLNILYHDFAKEKQKEGIDSKKVDKYQAGLQIHLQLFQHASQDLEHEKGFSCLEYSCMSIVVDLPLEEVNLEQHSNLGVTKTIGPIELNGSFTFSPIRSSDIAGIDIDIYEPAQVKFVVQMDFIKFNHENILKLTIVDKEKEYLPEALVIEHSNFKKIDLLTATKQKEIQTANKVAEQQAHQPKITSAFETLREVFEQDFDCKASYATYFLCREFLIVEGIFLVFCGFLICAINKYRHLKAKLPQVDMANNLELQNRSQFNQASALDEDDGPSYHIAEADQSFEEQDVTEYL